MNTLGFVSVDGERYYLQIKDVKASERFLLISPYTAQDRERVEASLTAQEKVLGTLQEVTRGLTGDYVLEGIERLKVTGKVRYCRAHSTLSRILDVIAFARNYRFRKCDVSEDENNMVDFEPVTSFIASDNTLTYRLKTKNHLIQAMYVKYRGIVIDVNEAKGMRTLPAKSLEWREAESSIKKQILVSTLKKVTYEMLCEKLDMSWYRKDGKDLKRYRTIKNIAEFEDEVIRPLALKAKEATERQEELILSLDTETTGLNICNLAADNPGKDHCVAIPLSWEDDQAVVVFTDMFHFGNVPNEYAWDRLRPFLEKGEEVSVTLRNTRKKEGLIDRLTIFSAEQREAPDEFEIEEAETITFNRRYIDLTGHNVIFDGKVGMDNGVYPEWNDDTMQMAFDLCPTLIKGNNKLKMLTRKLFGHETPELSDVLGKGDEDKYKYLSDEEVAKVYGCADADYTRKLRIRLKEIMDNAGMDAFRFRNGEKPVSLFTQYRRQDVPMLNILYRSEYNGMRMVREKVLALAQASEADLTTLKEFMYQYVGRFISFNKQAELIRSKYGAGLLTEQEYHQGLAGIQLDGKVRYEFEIKGSSIRMIIYDILKYPIMAYTKGKKPLPSVDKKVMKKLIAYKKDATDSGGYQMQEDLLVHGASAQEVKRLRAQGKDKAADALVLVKAEAFNKAKYPLALVLQKYAELNKEYTSYFKPILNENMEGKLFKGYSLARIETRRIMNPAQTMKANLKAMVRSYGDDYYVCDWDMSQVEYRIMVSHSGHEVLISKMSNPENDYHTETAAMINRIKPYEVTKKQRKNAKNVSFGKPYGLAIASLAEIIFGDKSQESVLKTQLVVRAWEESNAPIVAMLEAARDAALVPVTCSDEFRDFIDMWEHEVDSDGRRLPSYKLDADGNKISVPFGIVTNKLGFYRIFNLSNLTDSRIASIRREAGNFPIQSYAAELFRKILMRFYNRCEREGIADKVIWHMLIHDELLCSVHKSVHPFKLYKILKEECMVSMKGHTKYFIGINIGNTWAECKDDAREAPVYFVQRMINRYEAGEFKEEWIDDPGSFVMKYRKEYIRDRIGEIIKRLQPDIEQEAIDVAHIESSFENYTVRAYVTDYYKPNYKIAPPENEKSDSQMHAYNDLVWESKFETWAREYFGDGKEIIHKDGVRYPLHDRTEEDFSLEVVLPDEEGKDAEDVMAEIEDYWSFDTTDLQDAFTGSVYVWDEENDFRDEADALDLAKLDTSKDGSKGVCSLLVNRRTYQNLLVADSRLLITVKNNKQLLACKKYLKDKVYSVGYSVIFRTPIGAQCWLKVDSALDLADLDRRLEEWV